VIGYKQGVLNRISYLPQLLGLLAALGLLIILIVEWASAAVIFQDINPDNSTLDTTTPLGASGGRVNGLASVPGDNQVFYAATEWGGLYTTTDGGLTWSRLNGHLPVATWDIEVDPSNTNTLYATSFYDGRVNPLSGIQVSYNAGSTWAHPATAQPNNPASEGTPEDNTPQATFSCATARRAEPSAFGIGIRPDAPQNVFIGTNCGVAISNDSGATWRFVDPTPGVSNSSDGSDAGDVWDVVVQAGGPTGQGIVDICGDDGHLRSTDGGNIWNSGTPGLRFSGTCSIAASPDESYVLFVAIGTRILESDDAGNNWTSFVNPFASGRIPFVVTNQESNDAMGNDRFDLWFGDVSLARADCTTPATPAMGGATRCPGSPSWAGPFTRTAGAHDDSGDLVFDTEAANDACPMIFSSDGGVYYNTDLGADCQNPNWEQPNVTPHALWAYGMDGANQPGDASEDLYFGAQDDGTFAATDAGAASPSFSNIHCCDSFDVVADSNRVVVTTFSPYRFRVCSPGMVGCSTLSAASLPPGCCPQAIRFMFADYIDTFGDKQYIAVTPSGAFITNDITASPVTWTQLGTVSTPAGGFCGVQAAVSGGNPTFYAQTSCVGVFETQGSAQLWKYTGTAPGGNWNRVDNNDGLIGGFGIFAVDPKDPDRLYASNLDPAGPRMVFSINGGQDWDNDPELDNLMRGNGAFNYQTRVGPTSFLGFNGYVQPSLLTYDPEDSNIVVAGGRDSGVFLSTDGGVNWSLLTDPVSSDTSGIPHLPRPWFAYFDHEPAGTINLFVGTQGRGVWRFTLRLPMADANGPYVTDEGVDVVLDGTGSSDPDGAALTFEWDLDNDGVFDDATGPNPVFDMVGQDGVFPVALKVTAGGVFDIDETTVTVNNVAPSVNLASNAPVDEGSPVTVSGTVTDPGWLDPLTATIDWGDGSPVENIVGTLENIRPDATFTFSISHIYGDNGVFNTEVRGFDDDTSTAANINLTIDNVDPTAEIDESGTILINGIPTFLAHAGEPIDFSGRSTDPGSDDLTLRWNWDDGSPIEETIYLVNPPDPDPFPSPSIQPRDITDTKSHTFTDACLYEIEFWAEDDDGGLSQVDTAIVIIVGNADQTRTAGYWEHQFLQIGKTDFDEDALTCYLAIVAHMSQVFNEVRDASTIEKAQDVLLVDQTSDMQEIFDRQLLAVWLNFANGSIELDVMVDTDGDGTLDTLFSDAVSTAEAVRLDPSATREALEIQKNILERINQLGE
jgi:hypothetical protein